MGRYRDIAQAYVEAACWSSLDPETGEPLDSVDLAPGEAYLLGLQAARWARANWELAEAGAKVLYGPGWTGWEGVGHNLWLSMQRHGTGFWDRGLGDLGDRLHEAALSLPEHAYGWIGEDGLGRFEW